MYIVSDTIKEGASVSGRKIPEQLRNIVNCKRHSFRHCGLAYLSHINHAISDGSQM
jgi:hypothetical protein